MRKVPCEKAFWKILPVIRKEMACCMVLDFGLTQQKAAEILGITPATICQYKCNKRAKGMINNQTILEEIKSSVETIINDEKQDVGLEICRICKLMKISDIHPI